MEGSIRYFGIIVFFLIASCNSKSNEAGNVHSKSTSVNEVVLKDKIVIDSNYQDSMLEKEPISMDNPDFSIAKIQLLNSESVEKYIGSYKLNEEDLSSDYPYVILLNKDSTLLLRMYFYPGSSRNEFSKFELSSYSGIEKNAKIVDVLKMETNNQVRIGMPEKEFINILKLKEFKVITNGAQTKVYSLSIDDFENNLFLKTYNMPSYVAKYYILNEYVDKIEFGFEFP